MFIKLSVFNTLRDLGQERFISERLLTIWHICHILNVEKSWRLQWINLKWNCSILFLLWQKDYYDEWIYKKTQENPRQEIRPAKSYHKDYLERMKGNE